MKKTLALVLIILFAFVFVCCGKTPKEEVFKIVETKFDKIVTACENKNVEALLDINGITKVKVVDEYVVVFCKGRGIAPSSQDYGFYYSKNNTLVTIDCNLEIVCKEDNLVREGNGFKCVVSGNEFYTEHIKGSIYFYSTAY